MEQDYFFCERVDRRVPKSFCELVCRGERYKTLHNDLLEYRKSKILPLTEEQKNDKDVVSVVITAREPDVTYVERTVNSLKDNAVGPIEILLVLDGSPLPEVEPESVKVICYPDVVGIRKALNYAAQTATGKYIIHFCAHCAISPEWDVRMKSSCDPTDMITPVIDVLDPDTWTSRGGDMVFSAFNEKLQNYWVRPWKHITKRKLEEETMAIPGEGRMLHLDYYRQLGGCDESLGLYGALGSEWSLKVWLTGGRCAVRTDVFCSHLFRTRTPYCVDRKSDFAFKELYRRWVLEKDPSHARSMEWLCERFKHYLRRRSAALSIQV